MEKVETREFNGHQIATAVHDTDGKNIVIFCHGYRSSSIGPSRLFVKVARLLAECGISSLRFDQYGSGNSEGDFYESSFNDWVVTTQAIVDAYIADGYNVALFGQSMGGSTALCAAAGRQLRAVVAWVPDASVDAPNFTTHETVEEGGQVVQGRYWHEAHEVGIATKLGQITAPAYIVQCSQDEYVSGANHKAIVDNAQAHHIVEMFEGLRHSGWSHEQAGLIVEKSVEFLERAFLTSDVSSRTHLLA